MKTNYTFPLHVTTTLVILLLITAYSSVSSVYAQSHADLQEYVGLFEGRDISITGTTLHYKREGMPRSVAMKRIGNDHFEIIIPPGAQVRGPADGQIPTFQFNRNSSGEIESLSMVNPDKTVLATYKKSSQSTVAERPDVHERLPSVELPFPLDQVLRDYEKAWRDGQGEVLAGLFVDSGFVTSDAGWVKGRDAIKQKYTNTGGDLRLRALDFDMDDSAGYIVGAFGYGENATDRDLGIFVLALRKSEEGKWLIVADMEKINR